MYDHPGVAHREASTAIISSSAAPSHHHHLTHHHPHSHMHQQQSQHPSVIPIVVPQTISSQQSLPLTVPTSMHQSQHQHQHLPPPQPPPTLPTQNTTIYQSAVPTPTGGATVLPLSQYTSNPYGNTPPIYQGPILYANDQYNTSSVAAAGQMSQYPLSYSLGYHHHHHHPYNSKN